MSTVTTAPGPHRTDAELAALDVPVLLRFGLPRPGPHRRGLFGEGAVAAALRAEACGAVPHAVAYLAELVRAAGLRAAAELPEPLAGPDAAALAREWLEAARSVLAPGDLGTEELVADWLDAVALVLGVRRASGRG
ncbi:hypothetical protein ACIQBJ_19840 [Kitasatospora sp. NPDC088391]|uniref:hypothetical protein n=1 Tax=Kitasatospora sp. NPDC088391 TaxID=3364074 RepID=UPI003819342B